MRILISAALILALAGPALAQTPPKAAIDPAMKAYRCAAANGDAVTSNRPVTCYKDMTPEQRAKFDAVMRSMHDDFAKMDKDFARMDADFADWGPAKAR